ncbi:MAG: hypothetical protein OXF50_24490 [Caldilineaceae bacterium]|nr:hypothetical protein [Caldilineaceae bacterium]
MNKVDDQDTLSALLQESAGEDLDKFLLARWGYRFLLEADNVSEIYRQRYSDAGPDFPDFPDMLLAGFEIFHLIWREVGRNAGLKHPWPRLSTAICRGSNPIPATPVSCPPPWLPTATSKQRPIRGFSLM